MTFSDELNKIARSQENINHPEQLKQVIDQSYMELITAFYSKIKNDIKNKVKTNKYETKGGQRIVTGEYSLQNKYTTRLPHAYKEQTFNYGTIQHTRDSEYSVDWYEIQWNPLYNLEYKSGVVHGKIRFSLTDFGKKVTHDLQTLAKKDHISMDFYAKTQNVNREGITIHEFDAFHRYAMNSYCLSAALIAHYEMYF